MWGLPIFTRVQSCCKFLKGGLASNFASTFFIFMVVLLVVLLVLSSSSQWFCWYLFPFHNVFVSGLVNTLFVFMVVLLVPFSFLQVVLVLVLLVFSSSLHWSCWWSYKLFYFPSSSCFFCLILCVLFIMLPSSSSWPSLLLLIFIIPHLPLSPLFHLYYLLKWNNLATMCFHVSIVSLAWLLTSFWSFLVTSKLTPLYPNSCAL